MRKISKVDLSDITFCIPVRIESTYRMQNLYTLLKYLTKFVRTNFIVLEADQEPKLKDNVNIDKSIYVYVKDEDAIFHRTKYINQMLHMVETPYAAIWDTDAIAKINQIQQAYKSLQSEDITLVYPFSGTFICLNDLISHIFSKTIDIQYIIDTNPSSYLMNGFYSVGGAYMVNVKKYLEAGGENEYFYGWGPEDAERNARIQILELGVERVTGSLFHFFHTRGINSRDASDNNALKNKMEFCKVCSMTTLELHNYVETWPWKERTVI